MNLLAQFDRKVRDEADLLQFEREIARRADLLAAARGGPSSQQEDVECWLEAERQILQGSFSWIRPARARPLRAA
jgi:hypothetical protein